MSIEFRRNPEAPKDDGQGRHGAEVPILPAQLLLPQVLLPFDLVCKRLFESKQKVQNRVEQSNQKYFFINFSNAQGLPYEIKYKTKMMNQLLEKLNFGTYQPYKSLDILVKMISMNIKSTRLSREQKKKMITVLGLLDKLDLKLSIENIEENNFENKENSKQKWNNGVKQKNMRYARYLINNFSLTLSN